MTIFKAPPRAGEALKSKANGSRSIENGIAGAALRPNQVGNVGSKPGQLLGSVPFRGSFGRPFFWTPIPMRRLEGYIEAE
jgi:hypothetical protein